MPSLAVLQVEWREDRARMLCSVPSAYWTEAWMSMRNLTLEAALPHIQTPVLVIAGGTDSLLSANIADAVRFIGIFANSFFF